MKTKFTINDEIFGQDMTTSEECFEYYEKHYKDSGFILDKENEEVYIIYDKEIQLKEGDRVDLFGIRLVRWKCYDVVNDVIEYALEEE